MTATVYVVQAQMRFDHNEGSLVPKFDLSPAEKYGELIYLLSPSAAPFRPESVVREMREKLAAFGAQDYLLLIGNPVLIGIAAMLAAQRTPVVTFLQWSGRDQGYLAVSVALDGS